MTKDEKLLRIYKYCSKITKCELCPLYKHGDGGCYAPYQPDEVIDKHYNILFGGNEMSEIKKDAINPSHYKQGGIECIEALKAATINLKGIDAVCTANAIKYLWRWKEKNGLEDLNKAIWYINRLIKENTHE